MHRIYKDVGHKFSHSDVNKRPKIFMVHGILDSSDIWILNGAEMSPAFMAAKAGYDVWLSNTRGNKYSYEHIELDYKYDSDYWDHSFIELAKFDIPAFIDYIRKFTNMITSQKITLIGHSQGGSSVLYALNYDPEYYKANVNLFVAIAPATRITKMAPVNEITKQIIAYFGPVLEFFGFHQVAD